MSEIKLEVRFELPDLYLDKKSQEYLKELMAEVIQKHHGSIGLIIALETYLDK